MDIKVGDYAQWTFEGVTHEPRKVRVILDDSWVFMDGLACGVPIEQCRVVNPVEPD